MRVLVTGGTNGMGKGVARALAARDGASHDVVILGRSPERGASTIDEIRRDTGNSRVSFVTCDLTRMSDVARAVDQIRTDGRALDGIFVNAGVGYAAARVETGDGFDTHFQVNYLSQFVLTLRLLDLMQRSDSGGRVVFNVTEGGRMFWDDPQLRTRWSYEAAIHQAMVAKRMCYGRLHALARRIDGSRTAFFGFQIPKTVWSHQIAIVPWPMRAMATLVKWFGGFISIDRCGEIIAPLFTEPQEASLARSGHFITATAAGFVAKDEDPAVADPSAQEQLWRLSLEWCGDAEARRIAAAWAGAAATSGPLTDAARRSPA